MISPPARLFGARLRKSLFAAASITKWLVSGPPFLFLLLFFLLPGIIMLVASFRYPGEFGGLAPIYSPDPNVLHGLTLETYRFFFSDVIYVQILLKSFVMALATTLICLLLAYPLALLIARSPKKRRDFMVLLVILPFASSFLIRVYSWMILLGPQAYLSRLVNALLGVLGIAPVHLLFSPFAVLIAMVYVHLPFMVLPLYTNLEKHDPSLLDAAQDCGASPWQRFWRVTFPLSLPGIFSGALLVFIPVLGIFAIPDILGGTGDMLTGNLIKEQFLVTRDWPFGSTLSIMLTVTVLLCVWVAAKLGSTRGRYA
jgi:spermidine/putrescine transport system permease protein